MLDFIRVMFCFNMDIFAKFAVESYIYYTIGIWLNIFGYTQYI